MVDRNASYVSIFILLLLLVGRPADAQELTLELPPLDLPADVADDSPVGLPPELPSALPNALPDATVSELPQEISTQGAAPLPTSKWQKFEMQLTRESAQTRARAARELGAIGASAEPALDSLYERLNDQNSEVRMHSAHAIGEIGGQIVPSVEMLLSVLSDPDEHVRYAAEWSIAELCVQAFPKKDIARMRSALESANTEMLSRDHHAGHQSVIEQVIEALRARSDPPMPAETEVFPAPDLGGDQANDALDALRQELLLLPAQFDLGDLVSQLKIIDFLGEIEDFELKGVLFDVRREILKHSVVRSQTPCLFYALHRWGPSGHIAAMQLFDQLGTQNLPEWSVDLLYEVRPRSKADSQKLLTIALGANRLPVRLAAVNALSRSVNPLETAADLLAAANEGLLEPELRVSLLRSFKTLLLEAKQDLSAEREGVLLTLISNESAEWPVRLEAGRTVSALVPESSMAARTFAQAATRHNLLDHELVSALNVVDAFKVVPEAAHPLVHRGLGSSDQQGKLAALEVVERMANDEQEAVENYILDLFVLFANPEESTQVLGAAARALLATGPESLEGLGEQICLYDDQCRVQSMQAISTLGCQGLPCFNTCVRIIENSESSPASLAAASLTLASMGREARAAAPQVRNLFRSSTDISVRSAALVALSRIDEGSSSFIRNVGQESGEPAWPVILASSAYVQGDQQGMRDLVHLLESPATRPYARDALQDIGADAMPMLLEAVRNPSNRPEQRVQAMATLLHLPDVRYEDVLPVLQDDVIGQACADCMSGHMAEDYAAFLQNLVGMMRRTEGRPVHARLRQVLESQVAGLGSGADEDPDFGSYLAMDIMEMARAATPEPAEFEFQVAEVEDYAVEEETLVAIEEPGVIPSLEPSALPPATAEPSTSLDDTLESLGATKPMPQALPEEVDVDGSRPSVNVFFGTNRARLGAQGSGFWSRAEALQKLLALVIAIAIIGIWLAGRLRQRVVVSAVVVMAGLVILMNGLGFKYLRVQAPDSKVTANGEQYGGEYSDELKLGVCQVTVPEHHQYGDLDSASVFKLEFQKDPTKHVFLADVNELQPSSFFLQLNQELDVKGKQLLVFVHGYNVSFEDAARRSAQLAYDLNFEGAPVFYSWPSRGNWYKYRLDRKNVELSVGHIKQFLLELAEKSEATSIHLVAHSMGNVGLTEALSEIENEGTKPRFNQVVLAAPDIDADIFRSRIAPKIVSKAERCTVYTSKEDLALVASRYFNAGNRVGETLPQSPYPGVEFVDASEVDTSLLGHSYYGNASLLRDLEEVLRAKPLPDRTYVRAMEVGGIPAWYVDSPYIERKAERTSRIAETRALPAIDALFR